MLYINDRKNDGVVFRRFADGRGQPEQIASNAQGFFLGDVTRDSASIIVTTGAGVTGFTHETSLHAKVAGASVLSPASTEAVTNRPRAFRTLALIDAVLGRVAPCCAVLNRGEPC